MSARGGDELAFLRGVFADVLSGARPAPDAPDPAASSALPHAWDQAVELGWPYVALPEAEGGAGGSAGALVALAEALGRHAVSLPLVETALVRWALHRAGAEQPSAGAALTLALSPALALASDTGTVAGVVPRVAWGRVADQGLFLADAGRDRAVVLVPLGEGVRVEPGANLAGEPRDTLVFDGAPCRVVAGVTAEEVERYAAVAAAGATLGAMTAARRATRSHAATRSQFGRPLARFQLVGAHLAEIASLVETSRVLVDDAVRALDGGPRPLERAAVAKAWTARAAAEVAERAHQVHGALGITREYELHLATRRLWAWREEWGPPEHWERRLGSHAIAGGSQAAWEVITT